MDQKKNDNDSDKTKKKFYSHVREISVKKKRVETLQITLSFWQTRVLFCFCYVDIQHLAMVSSHCNKWNFHENLTRKKLIDDI